MSSSLRGRTGDSDLPYYMEVIFEKNHCSQTDWQLSSLPPGLTMCVEIRNPRNTPSQPKWLSWPSVPEGTERDNIDFYDPLGEPRRCCSFDNCEFHCFNRDLVWWYYYYMFLKNQIVRVDSVRLFLQKYNINCNWIVIKLLSDSTDLAVVAIDSESCWLLVDVLRRIMRNISEKCFHNLNKSDRFPEFLRELSNVWLSLNRKAFYTMVLSDLMKELPHTSYLQRSCETRWFITVSTVLIVLQRVSHDFQTLIRGDNGDGGATFYEIVILNDNWLIGAFCEAMRKCTPAAVPLSLFLPKATVLATCDAFSWRHSHAANFTGALRYMIFARMSPAKLRATVVAAAAASTTDNDDAARDNDDAARDNDDAVGDNDDDILGTKTAQLLFELDARISLDGGLAARSLLTLLRTRGIAWVVRYFRESRAMPPSMWMIVHRYFYGASWRFVYAMNNFTNRRKTDDETF